MWFLIRSIFVVWNKQRSYCTVELKTHGGLVMERYSIEHRLVIVTYTPICEWCTGFLQF